METGVTIRIAANADPESILIARQRAELVSIAWNRLGVWVQRELVARKHGLGDGDEEREHTYREMAQWFEISEAKARAHTLKARQKIRRFVRQQETPMLRWKPKRS